MVNNRPYLFTRQSGNDRFFRKLPTFGTCDTHDSQVAPTLSDTRSGLDFRKKARVISVPAAMIRSSSQESTVDGYFPNSIVFVLMSKTSISCT